MKKYIVSLCQETNYLFLIFLFAALTASHSAAWTSKTAPPLPEPTGEVVRVSTVSELNDAVSNLTTGTTILIEPGDYALTRSLVISGPDSVSLRGATGNREDVILRGKGMREENYGSVPHCISVYNSDDVLIADLTVADAWYHCMHLAGSAGPIRPHIYNVHFLDGGEQLLKVNPGYNPTAFPDTGLVEYCRFEYTDRAKCWYTNGVDILGGAGWVVRDNEFVRIRGPVDEMCGPAVLLFVNAMSTIVERNFFLNCDVAIGCGIFYASSKHDRGMEGVYAHRDGIVRNNMIIRNEPGGDAGILAGYSSNFKIYNNTIILNGTAPHTILYGDSVSSGEIKYNLADGPFQATNDLINIDPWSPGQDGEPVYEPSAGGESRVLIEGNITEASPDWFADLQEADLHLTQAATAAIDHAGALYEVADDYDRGPRPAGAAPDIGADEYGSLPPEQSSGDVDLNGRTDIFDLIQLLKDIQSGVASVSNDLDGNGKLDIFDLLSLIGILASGS